MKTLSPTARPRGGRVRAPTPLSTTTRVAVRGVMRQGRPDRAPRRLLGQPRLPAAGGAGVSLPTRQPRAQPYEGPHDDRLRHDDVRPLGNADVDECHRMVDRAMKTASRSSTRPMYDDGTSETILGEALRGRRDQVVLATKVGNPMGDGAVCHGAGSHSPATTCAAGRPHRPLPDAPTPTRPRRSTKYSPRSATSSRPPGKVAAIGTSTFSAARIRRRRPTCDVLGGTTTDERATAVLGTDRHRIERKGRGARRAAVTTSASSCGRR